MRAGQSLEAGHDSPAAPRARSALDTPAIAAAAKPSAPPRRKKSKWRGWWLKQLHSWHWISAAVALIGMFLFTITGLTLNHAATISATPQVTSHAAMLPPPLLRRIQAKPAAPDAPLPDAVAAHVANAVGLDPHGKAGEWSDADVYIAMPGPGRDAWVSIDRTSGAITSELTNRGWVSFANDLHKGRNTGGVWFWFIDAFAVAGLIFTITGLLLLQLHAKHRRSTWPLVALSAAIPLGITLFFMH